jgi:hypothetical protein
MILNHFNAVFYIQHHDYPRVSCNRISNQFGIISQHKIHHLFILNRLYAFQMIKFEDFVSTINPEPIWRPYKWQHRKGLQRRN